MNHPTREEFEQLKEQVKRIEQKTEEIKTVKVEVASKDVLDRLDKLEAGQQRLEQNQEAHFNALSQRIVDEANETVERVEALLIKYLKPSTNRSEEHTSELQSRLHLVCRLLLEKKNNDRHQDT